MSAHDDPAGMRITMGVPPGTGTLFWIGHILSGTPTVVMILNSVLAGVIATVAAVRVGAVAWVAFGAGAVAFIAAVVLQGLHARGNIAKTRDGYRPLSSTPTTDP